VSAIPKVLILSEVEGRKMPMQDTAKPLATARPAQFSPALTSRVGVSLAGMPTTAKASAAGS
jgi:hypothetical protein